MNILKVEKRYVFLAVWLTYTVLHGIAEFAICQQIYTTFSGINAERASCKPLTGAGVAKPPARWDRPVSRELGGVERFSFQMSKEVAIFAILFVFCVKSAQ